MISGPFAGWGALLKQVADGTVATITTASGSGNWFTRHLTIPNLKNGVAYLLRQQALDPAVGTEPLIYGSEMTLGSICPGNVFWTVNGSGTKDCVTSFEVDQDGDYELIFPVGSADISTVRDFFVTSSLATLGVARSLRKFLPTSHNP
jgi:hypothetical protein